MPDQACRAQLAHALIGCPAGIRQADASSQGGSYRAAVRQWNLSLLLDELLSFQRAALKCSFDMHVSLTRCVCCSHDGEERLPSTLPEALAAIKLIGSSWPARYPRTPVSPSEMYFSPHAAHAD